MRATCSSLALSLLVVGCHTDGAGTPDATVREAQTSSFLGPTEKWNLDGEWRSSVPGMRDRAYRFCFSKHPGDRNCFDDQDQSLLAAAQADVYAGRAMRRQIDPADEIAASIALSPEIFRRARAFCLSVYRDGGAADARALGPCFVGATGGDYFGVRGVP